MIKIFCGALFLLLINMQGCGDTDNGGGGGKEKPTEKTYTTETLNGFKFKISSEFTWDRHTDNAYRYAGKSLDDLVTVLPSGMLSKMRTATFRIEKPADGKEPVEYDAAEDIIVINDLGAYYSAAKLNRPSLLLNALVRRHYELYAVNSQPLVEQSYEAALGSGLYSSVDYNNGTSTVKKKADAAGSAEDYFVELSEAYWGKNDFYPFDYHDLMEYDAAGFQLMENIWGERGSNGFRMKDYDRYRLQGYDVMIRKSVADHPKLDEALELLDKKLSEIDAMVDKPFADFFKRRKIWGEIGSGSTIGGAAEHHPSREWLKNNGRYVEKYNCVEVSNLENFIAWCGTNQPLMILHEFAHAYHFSFSDNYSNQANVLAAYNNAVNAGLYTNVDYIGMDGQVSKRDRAYALNNEKEFFAENTEAYFNGNEFYPHNRQQLKEYDKTTWELMENVWNGDNFKE